MEKGIKQLFTVTGARGTGKSTLAATYLPPSRIKEVIYLDTEKSANNIRANLKRLGLDDFGKYIDLQERFSDLPKDDDLLDRINRGEPPWASSCERNALIGYYQHVIGELSTELVQDKYSVAVIDTGEKVEAGMAAFVEANKGRFGVTTTAYGKLWTEGVYPLYQNLFQGIWQRGVDTIILNFHLKNVWDGNRPVPGKVGMSGKKILYTLSSLMLWLENDSRNPNGEPAALVIKERLGQADAEMVKEDRWGWKQTLPPRIPCATWEEIDKYLSGEYKYNPSAPKPKEVRSPGEDDMISDLYNDAQLALMLTDAKLQEQSNTLALVEAGIVGSPVLASDPVAVVVSDNGGGSVSPKSRADALAAWRALGRAVPVLLKRIAGLGDDQIAAQWDTIVAAGDK